MSDLLTTAQAAELAGVTPAGFRRAVNRDTELREARIMLDARTPAYPRDAVLAWRARTPRRIVKGAATLVVLALGVVGLSACGGTDEPTSAVEPVVTSEVVEPGPVASEPVAAKTAATPQRECVTADQVTDLWTSFRGLDSADEFQRVIDLLAKMAPCGDQARARIADYTNSAEINRDTRIAEGDD